MDTIRELPPNEWGRLAGHPAFNGMPLPDPAAAVILVAEDGDQIVGVHVTQLQLHLHAEPLWVAPERRGSLLAHRLFQTSLRSLDTCGPLAVYCFTESSTVAGYLERLGAQSLPYRTHLLTWPLPSLSQSVPLDPTLDPVGLAVKPTPHSAPSKPPTASRATSPSS